MDERDGVVLYQSYGNRGMLDVCLCLGCSSVGGEWVGGLEQGLEEWGGVMTVLLGGWVICVGPSPGPGICIMC